MKTLQQLFYVLLLAALLVVPSAYAKKIVKKISSLEKSTSPEDPVQNIWGWKVPPKVKK